MSVSFTYTYNQFTQDNLIQPIYQIGSNTPIGVASLASYKESKDIILSGTVFICIFINNFNIGGIFSISGYYDFDSPITKQSESTTTITKPSSILVTYDEIYPVSSLSYYYDSVQNSNGTSTNVVYETIKYSTKK